MQRAHRSSSAAGTASGLRAASGAARAGVLGPELALGLRPLDASSLTAARSRPKLWATARGSATAAAVNDACPIVDAEFDTKPTAYDAEFDAEFDDAGPTIIGPAPTIGVMFDAGPINDAEFDAVGTNDAGPAVGAVPEF